MVQCSIVFLLYQTMDKVQISGNPVNKIYVKGTSVAFSKNFSDVIRMEIAQVLVTLVPETGDLTGQLQRNCHLVRIFRNPILTRSSNGSCRTIQDSPDLLR
jgi:hypothetical protein